jgi:hypothetical protein
MRSSNDSEPLLAQKALWVAAFAFAAALVLSAPPDAPAKADAAAPSTLDALLQGFQGMPGLEARFEEEKHVALLAAPLTSRGRLYFAPPSTLLRRVESPQPAEVLITPTGVRIRQGSNEEVIDLRARRDVRPLVESMLWIFRGDRQALEGAWRVTYRPLEGEDAGRWRLSLRPRGAPLDRLIAELSLEGRGYAVTQIEVKETSGDRTVTRILEANPRRTFTPEERQRLFGITSP